MDVCSENRNLILYLHYWQVITGLGLFLSNLSCESFAVLLVIYSNICFVESR